MLFFRSQWTRFAPLLALLCLSLTTAQAQNPVPVLTRSYTNQRLGNNTQETLLTPANVNATSFGMLFSRQVDGEIYAQPLYVPNLTINGKTQNVVIVATMRDSLYAFDADDPNAAAPLWQTTYANPAAGITSIPTSDMGFACGGNYKDISSEVGVLSTPVIDPNTGTLYLVARTKEVSGSSTRYVQRIHAVDITTGLDRIAPVTITAQATTRSGGAIYFDPLIQNQRAALLLDHGVIYIAWASHCDGGSYHGWVMAYDPFTLAQKGVFCATPDGTQGGIWQSGQGPAADADGNIYVVVGNGDSSVRNNGGTGSGYANATVKLKLSDKGLAVVDWFLPYNTDSLNNQDLDSACGPVLFPVPAGKTTVFMGGKDGVAYLMDSANLGKYNPNNPGAPQNDAQIRASFQAANRHLHGSAGYFAGDAGTWMYLWGEYSSLHAYPYLGGGVFASTTSSTSSFNAPDGMPGAAITVSSNGTKNGVVWTNLPYQGDANQAVVPGVLRAFDATDVSKELWNSHQAPTRDDFGAFAKYCPPVVTNGKVYMATFSNRLAVYGVLPPAQPPTALVATGLNQSVGLSWNAGNYAASYNLYRSLSASGPFTKIASALATTGYLDSGLSNGTTYYYEVSSNGTAGESGPSNLASATPSVATGGGGGDGLTATYYAGAATNFSPELTNPLLITVDPQVNFANGYTNNPSPVPFDVGVPATQFTAVWTGKILAPYTAAYTFQTVSDDGVQVTLDGAVIINDATFHSGTYDTSAPVNLVAGRTYDVKIEFFQGTYGSIVQFLWSVFGQPFVLTPQSQLFSYPATAPAQVVSLTATASSGSVQLSWAGAAGAATFNVKRGLSVFGTFTTIATGVTAHAYKDSSVTNNVTYYYVVSAVNANGEGPNSVPAAALPTAGGVSIGVNFTGQNNISLASSDLAGVIPVSNWNNAGGASGTLTSLADSKGVKGAAQVVYSAYGVYSSGTGGLTGNNRLMDGYLDTSDFTTTTVTVSGLPVAYATNGYDVYVYTLGSDPGRSGVYTIGATSKTSSPKTWYGAFVAGDNYLFFPNVNNSGFQLTATPAANGGFRAPINAIQIVPHNAPPTNLTAAGQNAAVALIWTASADAGNYNVLRSLSASGPFSLVATGIAATTYTDTGLTNGTRYYYVVQTINGNGASVNSNVANATPSAPVVGTGNGLLGTYYSGDNANFSPETGTPILLTIDPTINFARDEIANYNPVVWDLLVPYSSFTAVWTGQFQAPYAGAYKFQTITDDGVRLTVNGTRIISAPNYQIATAFTSGAVTLTAGQKVSIKLEYFQGQGGSVCQLLYAPPGQAFQIIPQSQLYATTTTGAAGKTYNLNAFGLSSAIKLVWGGATNATTYTIKRSPTSGGPYTTIATGVTGRSYLDVGLANYATYYYTVNAVNASGSGAASNEAYATPYAAFQYLRYTFEDGPQGKNPDVITDVTGDGNDGAMVGGDAGFTADAAQGKYAALVSPGVHASLPANFDFYGAFSLFAWVKIPDAPNVQTIISNEPAGGGANGGFALYVNSANTQDHALTLEIYSNGFRNLVQTAPGAFPLGDGKYHSVAAVIDEYDGIASLYIDGAIVAQDAVIPTYFMTNAPFTNLGVFSDGTFGLANGAKIDDFQMYYNLLTPLDIAALNGARATVSGRVALEGLSDLTAISAAAPLGTFEVEFALPGTGFSLFTVDVAPNPVGAGSPYAVWSVPNVPLGVYDVLVKGPKNLRVAARNVVVAGNVSAPNMTLPGGDANNDNTVDASDFGLLVGAYNGSATVPGSGYDPAADFNGDGKVDSADLSILINAYGAEGAY